MRREGRVLDQRASATGTNDEVRQGFRSASRPGAALLDDDLGDVGSVQVSVAINGGAHDAVSQVSAGNRDDGTHGCSGVRSGRERRCWKPAVAEAHLDSLHGNPEQVRCHLGDDRADARSGFVRADFNHGAQLGCQGDPTIRRADLGGEEGGRDPQPTKLSPSRMEPGFGFRFAQPNALAPASRHCTNERLVYGL